MGDTPRRCSAVSSGVSAHPGTSARSNAEDSMHNLAGTPAIPLTLPRRGALSPRFTVRDVEEYARTHPHPQAIGVARVETVEFMSAAVLRRWYPWAAQLPAGHLFCLLTWDGLFRLKTTAHRNADGNRAWQVFDAMTGNLVFDLVGS